MSVTTSSDSQSARDADEVTALRRRVAELERAVAGRDAFIAMLGHELRHPLTPLSLHLEHLKARAHREPMAGEHLAEELAVVERRVERFVRLLDRVADVAQITAGTLGLYPEWLELDQLVREVVQAHDWELEIARCEVRLDLEGGVRGKWDAVRMGQIVTNLLSNAMKFGAGGAIDISLHTEDGEAVLRVRDHGVGITPDQLARIFEPFTRAAVVRDRPGLGIGLWVVAQVCAAFGGTVSVESELGAGATFIVRLPTAGIPR